MLPRCFPLVILCFSLTAAHAAQANVTPQDEPAAIATDERVQQAAQRFQKARELYQSGRYAEARDALLQAHALDPQAKDLVLNLGIVSEKMQEYDDALGYLQRYRDMPDVSEEERQRADSSIRRIEGARAHAQAQQPQAPAVLAPEPRSTPALSQPPRRGKMDGWTATALGVTAVALATGATFGALALGADPGSQANTGSNYSWQQLQRDERRSRDFALIADVSFGVSLLAAGASAILYFARTKSSPQPNHASIQPTSLQVSF